MQDMKRYVLGALLITAASCGGRGLPEPDPQPGEVDVGYGARPAGKVTGAVTTITHPDSAHAGEIRLEQLLRGKLAGLQIVTRPDGTQTLRIRGGDVSLLGQEREPLVVLDGVPVSGSITSALAGLTANDIRQIDILKDVASTAIYGMRGAAGVILITTNRR